MIATLKRRDLRRCSAAQLSLPYTGFALAAACVASAYPRPTAWLGM
jgi:hypothetical protein